MGRSAKRKVMIMLVKQWQGSGLSQREFAQKNNIPFSQIKYWINKYRTDKVSVESESSFIQLKGFTETSNMCIRYPNGVELSLPEQTPVTIIKSLINI